MPELVLEPEQPLADLERLIADAMEKLRGELEAASSDAGAPAVDPEYVNRWVETARRLSVQVSNALPPQLEPQAMAEIRKIIINLLDGFEQVDKDRPLDSIDRFFVGAEAMRHILRDALDEHMGIPDDDARELVGYLKDALPRITQADRARIAGVSSRHMQRLAKEGGAPPRQLVLAARLVKLLRYTWNPEGVIAWFHRERPELDGHAPIDVASDHGFERTLLQLARRGRAQHAA